MRDGESILFDGVFDKIMLLLCLGVMTGVIIYFTAHNNDKGFQWAMHAYDNFQGALLGLITGVAVGRKLASARGGGSSDPNPPKPAPESTPSK